MPILRVTASDKGLDLEGSSLATGLRRALRADPGPVTLMVHGYKYLPGHPVHCPHTSLLAADPVRADRRILSWPRPLGLHGQPGEGVGISFGWPARGSIWAAHGRAETAGDALAHLLARIHAIDPARPIHIVAHSLGARVTLRAIAESAPGTVARAILLAAAEFSATAEAALGHAGRGTQVLNVTSRENDLFDFLLERLIAPPRPGDRMLGLGRLRLPNMVTLQLDDARSLEALAEAGFPIAPPLRRICHWSPYTRDGVFPLYRAVLSGEMPLPRLRALLPADGTPRWSRLVPHLPRMALAHGGQPAAR